MSRRTTAISTMVRMVVHLMPSGVQSPRKPRGEIGMMQDSPFFHPCSRRRLSYAVVGAIVYVYFSENLENMARENNAPWMEQSSPCLNQAHLLFGEGLGMGWKFWNFKIWKILNLEIFSFRMILELIKENLYLGIIYF